MQNIVNLNASNNFGFYVFVFSTGLWVENNPKNISGIENTVVSKWSNFYFAFIVNIRNENAAMFREVPRGKVLVVMP